MTEKLMTGEEVIRELISRIDAIDLIAHKIRINGVIKEEDIINIRRNCDIRFAKDFVVSESRKGVAVSEAITSDVRAIAKLIEQAEDDCYNQGHMELDSDLFHKEVLKILESCIPQAITESRKGMFTEFVESINLSLDDEARKMESLYPQHERMVKKFLFRNKMIINELLTERKGR